MIRRWTWTGAPPALSRCLIAALFLLGSALPAAAGGLVVEGRLGLGGRATFAEDAPALIEARLAAGQPPFKGRLQVGAEGLQVRGTELELSLAPGSVRRVRLVIPYVRHGTHRVRLVEDEGGEGRVVEAELVDDTSRLDEKSVALLASEGWQALGADKKTTLLHVPPGELPRDVRGLLGLGALVVPLRPELREVLQDAELAATLREYVSAGGVVVFCGHPEAPRLWVGGPLEPLLPIRDPGERAARAEQVKSLLGAVEVEEFPCVSGPLAPGARWREKHGELGILAELPLGAGVTRYLAFDPDERGPRSADGLQSALRLIASPRSGAQGDRFDYDLDELASRVFEARPVLGPVGFVLIVGIVLVHSLVAVALSVVLRRRKRHPWLAMLIPPLLSGAIGTLVIVIAALAQDGPSARTLVVVTQPAGASPEQAPARAVVGLFSETPATVRLRLEAWSPEPATRGALESLQFRTGPPWVREEGAGLRSVGPIEIPGHGHSRWFCSGKSAGLPITALFDGTGWTISSSAELSDLVGIVVAPKGTVSLTELAPVGPGKTARFDPGEARPAVPVEIDGDPFQDPGALRQALEVAAAQVASLTRGRKDPTFLIGHFARRAVPLPAVEVAGGARVENDALVFTVVGLEAP